MSHFPDSRLPSPKAIILFVVITIIGCNPKAQIDPTSLELSKVDTSQMSELVQENWEIYQSDFSKQTNLETLTRVAYFLHANGLYLPAQRSYQLVISTNPTSATPHYLLSKILLDYGDYENAIEHLNRSLKLDPDYRLAFFKRGDILYKTGEIERAKVDFLQAKNQSSLAANAAINLAKISIDQNKPDEAISYLKEAIRNKPQLSTSYSLLASIMETKGEAAAARKYREQASESSRYTEPRDPWMEVVDEHCFDLYKIQVMADAAYLSGQTDRAIQYLKQARSLAPNDAKTIRDLAFILLKGNDVSEGITLLHQAVELDPDNPDAYSALVSVLADKKRWEEANRIAQLALERIPDSVDILQSAGLAAEGIKQKSHAEYYYLKAHKLDPQDHRTNLIIGKFYFSRKSPKQALPFLQKCRELKVDDTESRKMLLEYFLSRSLPDQAGPIIDELEASKVKGAAFDELKFHYLVQKGNQSMKAADFAQATDTFYQACKLNPQHIGVRMNLIVSLLRTDQRNAALDTAKVAINIARERKDVSAEKKLNAIIETLESE